MAKKAPEIKAMHDRRWEIILKVRELMESEDNKKKFDTLIKICKEFAELTKKLQSAGEKVDIGAKKYHTTYWEDRYNMYIEQTKREIQTAKPVVIQQKETQELYYIMLCWTVKLEYCVCDTVVNNVKAYLESMKLEHFDTEAMQFPDRVEYCHTFKLRATPEVYNVILSSAEYILNMSANSIYDNCNIGVFGRKIE